MGNVAVQPKLDVVVEFSSRIQKVENLSHCGTDIEIFENGKSDEKLSHCGNEVEISKTSEKLEKMSIVVMKLKLVKRRKTKRN